MKLKQLSFVSAISFSNSLVVNQINNMRTVFEFFDGFGEIYRNEKKKLPYHINIIDELRADENAHSRILAKFLMHEDLISNEYDILKSFIGYIVENYNDKKDFQNIEIKWPTLTVEKERIDLWIRDSNYAIILENKVQNAGDQYKQLERYINTTVSYGYDLRNIYVLYLPPTSDNEPEDQSWGKYFKTDIYNKRYLNLSFRDVVLPWLKHYVMPNVRSKDKLLISSLQQYVDYLEGMFSLRTINNKMNMKLQEFIKEKLEITDAEPMEALNKVIEKQEEVNNALSQLNLIKDSIILDCFREWEKSLKNDFPDLEIVGNYFKIENLMRIGVKINDADSSFSLLIEFHNSGVIYGIGKLFATDDKNNNFNFDEIVDALNLKTNDWWYGWKWIAMEDAYANLSILIDKVVNKKQYRLKDNPIGVDSSLNLTK